MLNKKQNVLKSKYNKLCKLLLASVGITFSKTKLLWYIEQNIPKTLFLQHLHFKYVEILAGTLFVLGCRGD